MTSSISMLEMAAAYFIKHFKVSRFKSSLVVSIVCFLLGSACSFSFGIWKDVTIFGMGFFDLFDFLVAKLLMPIGSALICIFLGWVVDEKVLRAEITNEGALKQPLYPVFRFIIRYFAPLCIILIFMNELGLFKILSGLLN